MTVTPQTLRLISHNHHGSPIGQHQAGLPLSGFSVAFVCPLAQTMLAKSVRDLGGEKVHHDLSSLPADMARVPDIVVLSYSARRSPFRQNRYLQELRRANPDIVTVCCDWTSGLAPETLYDQLISLPATDEALSEALIQASHLLCYARLKKAGPLSATPNLFGLLAAQRRARGAKAQA